MHGRMAAAQWLVIVHEPVACASTRTFAKRSSVSVAWVLMAIVLLNAKHVVIGFCCIWLALHVM